MLSAVDVQPVINEVYLVFILWDEQVPTLPIAAEQGWRRRRSDTVDSRSPH